MSDMKTLHHCFNCDTVETRIPLINLRYAENELWICPQCMPKLIHQPELIAGKLPRESRQQNVGRNSD